MSHPSESDPTHSRGGWQDSGPPRNNSFGGGSFGGNRSSSYGGGGGGSWSDNGPPRGGGRGGGNWDNGPSERPGIGQGGWKDGKHIIGARNQRLEKELYGEPNDPAKQQTGINFEKYDDIPVEANGAGVPEPVLAFTNPPLDPVLLENIGYASYTTPTPVQKYSIPIVAAGRDLMACAQVSGRLLLAHHPVMIKEHLLCRRVLARQAGFCSQSFPNHSKTALTPLRKRRNRVKAMAIGPVRLTRQRSSRLPHVN